MKLILAALLFLSLPLSSHADSLPVAAEYGPAPGTYGFRRCRNLAEQIESLRQDYREDSDESLRSLGFEGPNAQRGRTIRELRVEQEKWGCFEKREEPLRCDRLAADLKTTLEQLQADAVATFAGRKIPGRKERLEDRLEQIRGEGQQLGCRVAGEL